MTTYYEYTIAKGDNIDNLVANVKTLMSGGWQPLNGV